MADILLKDSLKDPENIERIAPTKIGSSDTNCMEVRADGTQRLIGTATAWKDMIADLFAKKLTVNTGKLDYDWEELALKFQSGGSISNVNDRVGGNLEINHEFKVGANRIFKPHIHWFQEIDNNTAQECTLTMEWRFQKNGEPTSSTWNTLTCNTGVGGDDIFNFTTKADGIYNQLSRFPNMVVDCNVSDTIQFRIARTDSNGGNMLVYFFDLHGEVDSFGSDEEITKIN